MKQLLPCPACEKIRLLPPGLSQETTVRCPHCAAEFVLRDLWQNRLEQWQVVDSPPHPMPLQSDRASGTRIECPPDDGTEELQLASADNTSPAAPLPSKKSVDWSQFKPITHDQFEKMKRKRASPLWSVVQIVLGGVAAVPIALLLIWHVIGTDVADAGPWVGSYMPWAVPERFRPFTPAAESTATPTRGRFRTFDQLEADSASGLRSPDRHTDPTAAGDETAPPATASGSSPPASTPAEPSKATSQTPAEASENSATLPDAITPGQQNLFDLIRQCELHLEEWARAVNEDKAQLRPLAKVIYSDLTELAWAIADLPQDSAVHRVVRDRMRTIGKSINRRDDLRSLVTQGARHWYPAAVAASGPPAADASELPVAAADPSNPQAASDSAPIEKPVVDEPVVKESAVEKSVLQGLALIVTIERVEAEGDRWIVTADRASDIGEPPPEIVIPKSLAPILIPQQALFLLGTVHSQKSPAEAPTQAPASPRFVASYLHGLLDD